MKVAMLALVLLVASVIVLIFANTLNSWVLGGLIGGLAALLISIPISLIIFTSLARRHDERLFAQLAEDEANAYGDEYDEVEADAYVLPQENEVYYQDESSYEDDYPQLDEDPRLNREPEMRRLSPPGQARQYTPPARSSLPRHEGQRTGHQRQARSPQTTRSLRSTQHAAALRAAMREAEQEHLDQGESSVSRRRPVTPRRQLEPKDRSIRTEQQRTYTPGQRTTKRHLKTPGNAPREQQTQRRPSGDLRYQTGQPERNEESYSTDIQDARTRYNPVTGPMRLNPSTDKIARNPQLGDEYNQSESWTGALNNPVVRRAPYLYEDDPLHEHFAQQVDKPIARRSSRYLQPEEE